MSNPIVPLIALLAIPCGFLAGSSWVGSSPPPTHADAKPDLVKLIRQLGSDDFGEREKAQRRLEDLGGEDELTALRAAKKDSTDAETQRRLGEVVTTIESRLAGEAFQMVTKAGGEVGVWEDKKHGFVIVKSCPASNKPIMVSFKDTSFDGTNLVKLNWLGDVKRLDLEKTKVTDDGLKSIQSLPDLEYLWLTDTRVSDAGLAHLKTLHQLRDLTLSGTRVRGCGLSNLKDLKDLTDLDLTGSDINDEGLAHIVGLKRLKVLGLGRTKVGDAGMKHVSTLPALENLSLIETGLTDSGLAALTGLKRLSKLCVVGTSTTPTGIAELHKTLPSLDVSR